MLPEGFTWNTPEALVGDAGEHIFLATFTPTDTENYSSVTNIEVKVIVDKKKAEAIVVPVIDEVGYDPNRTLADITLPEHWQWADSTIVPTVGNAGYQAIYTPDDANNYDYSEQNLTPFIKVPVKKADPNYTVPSNLQVEWGSTLADLQLPNGFSLQGDTDQLVGEIGTRKITLTYTPDDTNNYNVVTDIEVSITITKATLKVKTPDDISVQLSDGLKLADLVLPEGYRWLDPDMVLTSSGLYQVVYTPEDTEHYADIITYVKVNVISDTISNREVDNNEAIPNTVDGIFKYFVLAIMSLISITRVAWLMRKDSKAL